MSIYRRVLHYYRPFLGQTLIGLVLSLCGIALNLLKPWPFKIIVDDILPRNPHAYFGTSPDLIPLLCLALVGIQVLWGLTNLGSNYIFVKVGLQALLKLRTDLYAYLQSLSLRYHDARRSSDSSFRVAYDSQSIQTIYNKGFTNIFGSIITLIGTFLVMIRIDWQLTLLSLAVVPPIVAAIYFFAHRIRRDSTSIQEQESALLAQAQEICDRIGILADGVLVREGRLQELIAIENQTELVIADASDELMREIESFISRSNAKLLERRKSTTTLERLFLESTGGNDKSSTRE